MDAKVIKTQEEYDAALAEIERLIDRDPKAGTADANQLELCTLLVKDYESKMFSIGLPDPIEAIRFRMEQQGLSQSDLVPYIGSRGRVSEVLAGKRPLSLSMIRALHSGLNIPAEVLLQRRDPADLEEAGIEWQKFPLRELAARKLISGKVRDLRDNAEDLMRKFFQPIGLPQLQELWLKKTEYVRTARPMDKYALATWTACIIMLAMENPPIQPYEPGTLSLQWMGELARLSWSEQGPLLAKEFLGRKGIALVIEPHFQHTYLDSAAVMFKNHPIIALTLRHDRLDNYWFCLMHELVHLWKHLDNQTTRFFDDLDSENQDDPREREADNLATKALIPQREWEKVPPAQRRARQTAYALASRLGIHPAIVAGRIRYESKSYRVLKDVIGYGQVRRCFPEIHWSR